VRCVLERGSRRRTARGQGCPMRVQPCGIHCPHRGQSVDRVVQCVSSHAAYTALVVDSLWTGLSKACPATRHTRPSWTVSSSSKQMLNVSTASKSAPCHNVGCCKREQYFPFFGYGSKYSPLTTQQSYNATLNNYVDVH